MKTVYHIGSGATQFPYDVDADNAVQRHPTEWALAPWPVEKTNEWRQKDYDRRAAEADRTGQPPPAELPELSLSPQAQAEIDQDAKNRGEAQKVVDEADKREREAREWTAMVAAARATLAAAPVQPALLAASPDAAADDVAVDKSTDIPPGWRDMNNARRRGLALRLGAPRDIKQADANGYIEAEERRRAAPAPAPALTPTPTPPAPPAPVPPVSPAPPVHGV